jgi:hypothetical protein
MLQTVIHEVLGWDLEKKKQVHKGLFGKIDAFSCSIEEQGRSTLHAHILFWVTKVNKIRDQLHHPNRNVRSQAKRSIAKTVDRLSSTKCFFNGRISKRIVNGHVIGDKRRRFIHPCSNPRYGLPSFPTNGEFQYLRYHNGNNESNITCNHCEKKWSFNDLEESYLANFVGLPYYTTLLDENKARCLKAMAIRYQKDPWRTSIQRFVIDFGYILQHHTKSCFKNVPNKKKVVTAKNYMCRYRYPQVEQLKTGFKILTKDPLPWYCWDGSIESRHIMELVKNKEISMMPSKMYFVHA